MSTERIESLVSEQVFKEFEKLQLGVSGSVKAFEELISKGVALNTQLGQAKGIKDVNDAMSKMAEKEKELISTSEKLSAEYTKMLDMQKRMSAAQEKTAEVTEKTAKSQRDFGTGLAENTRTLTRYNLLIKSVADEMSRLKKDLDAGKISTDQYEKRMSALTKEQVKLKDVAANLNATIRQQVKEENSAAGSVENLKAKLALLTKTYDNLDRSQRNSSIGKGIKKQLNDVNNELKNLEAGTGRFQRNVGNYASAFSGFGVALAGISGALFGLSSVGQFFSGAIEEVEKAEMAYSRFKNTLEGVGKDESFERLKTQALELSETFGYFGDDDVIEIFDKLTTYGKLTEKQMTELTPVIIDFAAKAKIGLSEATEKIINGLNGQGKELKQYGINVRDASTVTERLGIVMTDLKGKVDGAGFAFRDTLTGSIEVAEERIRTLQGELGETLLPIWAKIKVAALESFAGIIQGITSFSENVSALYNSIFNPEQFAKSEAARGFQDMKKAADEYGVSFVKSVKGGIPELEKQLKVQYQLLLNDQQRLKTDKSKSSQQSALNSAAIVKGLQTEIMLLKEKNTLADKTEGKEGKTKATRESKSFFSDELKDQEALFKELAKGDTLYLNTRLNARMEAAKLERQIVEGNYKAEIFNANGNASKIAEIEQKTAYAKVKIQQTLQNDLDSIKRSYNSRLQANDDEITAQFKDQAKKQSEAELALINTNNEKRINRINENRDIELLILEKKYQEGAITEKQYANERARIEQYANIEILKQQIKFTEEYIALAKSRGEDVTASEAALAKARVALAQAETGQGQDSAAQMFEEQADAIGKVLTAYQELGTFVLGMLDARATAQKNAIEEEIELLEKRSQAEIEAVNASTLSQQEKADKITVISARAQAQRESLERRQRLVDQQRARYERAFTIGQIIGQTALNVVKALGTPPTPNIPAAVVAGAIGAGQLAVAIAQPIPKFRTGTKDAPGGLSIVGDGGQKEIVVTPDGKMIETPAVPTVMNIPAHSVVYPSMQSAAEQGIRMPGIRSVIVNNDNDLVARKIDRLTNVIRNKSEFHFHNKGGEWKKIIKNGDSFSEYLNNNLQF